MIDYEALAKAMEVARWGAVTYVSPRSSPIAAYERMARAVIAALRDQEMVVMREGDAARSLAFMRSCRGWWNESDRETADRIAAALAAPEPAGKEDTDG